LSSRTIDQRALNITGAIAGADDKSPLTSSSKKMSIKSDKWIRRMAEQHRMIEPFESGQVREVGGERIVSYGTSSYGYDIRASDEFKIFTNINSTIVDPKAFDPKSFVDFKGPVCIIPPNSFALARTVEYFRIPRNVLTVCLGKCLTADTRLVDAETGAYLPITEFGWGRRTLALKDWRLGPARVSALVPQGKKAVFELKTKAGLRIKATANHPFRQLHGWTELQGLAPGDRIAVARQVLVFGSTPIPDWEASLLGLMISEGQCRTPASSPVFTNEDPILVELLKRSVAEAGLGCVTHKGHLGYRIVNHEGRGGVPQRNRAYAWLEELGLSNGSADKFVPQKIFMAPEASVRLFLQALFAGDGGIYEGKGCVFLEYYSKSRRLIEDVHHLLLRFGIFSLIREKKTAIGTNAFTLCVTDVELVGRFAEYVGFVPGSIKQLRLENEILPSMRAWEVSHRKTNFDTLPSEGWELLSVAAAAAGTSLNRAGVQPYRHQSVGFRAVERIVAATGNGELAQLAQGPIWDTVDSIEPAGVEEVFDITVPGPHNFLANGLIVHNSTYARCGIIVNVTPFEPEWEGYVTLEFSNTTPLPAKIYANEGVAQVIFFESDEVCETSYADRGGKYQGQKGVTLPKI
jgi:deoxycytidine triphosphate deaminase